MSFSTVAEPIYIAINSTWESPPTHTVTSTYLCLLDGRQPQVGEEQTHCGSDEEPWWFMVLKTLPFPCWLFVCLFGKSVYSDPLAILKWMFFSYMNYLHLFRY